MLGIAAFGSMALHSQTLAYALWFGACIAMLPRHYPTHNLQTYGIWFIKSQLLKGNNSFLKAKLRQLC
jgi:hypothetical protein